MEKIDQMIAVRHLEDVNDLKKFGLNGGLEAGQEELAKKAALELITFAQQEGASYIELFASGQRRTSETAELLESAVSEVIPNFCEINTDTRLADLHQGQLNLPENYKEGDMFEPLRDGWNVFWDETFNKGDLLYKFGQDTSTDGQRKFPKLEGEFLKPGECYAQMAERYYDFLCSVLTQELSVPSKRLIAIIGHSITFGIMHELAVIAKDYIKPPMKPIPFGDLPRLTWEYFDKLKDGVLKNNPKYGEIALFDITYLKDEVFIEQLAIERDALRGLMTQSNVQY